MGISKVVDLRSFAACILFTSGMLIASAQAVQTASQRMHAESYALVSYARPAYDDSPAAGAVTAGLNLDLFALSSSVELSLDVRGVAARSTQINEASAGFGPRLSYRRFWVQPYAEYLFGAGRGTFNTSANPDYQRDYSAVRSYGGGIDLRTSRYVTFRADAQTQRWRFTHLAPYFHPQQVSVGVSYHLHTHSHTGPQL